MPTGGNYVGKQVRVKSLRVVGVVNNHIIAVTAIPTALSADDDIAAGGSHNRSSAGIGQVNAIVSVQALGLAAIGNRS